MSDVDNAAAGVSPFEQTVGASDAFAHTEYSDGPEAQTAYWSGQAPTPSQTPTGETFPGNEPVLPDTMLAGRYKIIRRLGAGGMGEVYLAEHTRIGKPVAIKILARGAARGPEHIERFNQEARAASQVRHANIVDITDFGETDDGLPFFAMEYLEGEDLGKTIKREGRLPWPRAKAIMKQILAALTAAHKAGVIHRDLKPDNCFLIQRADRADFIKLLDFGIAKVLSGDVTTHSLTQTGAVIGTPYYMSPEQAKCAPLDIRADLYSAGVILFQLVTGKVPFYASNPMGILAKHITEDPPSPSHVSPDAGISRRLDELILKSIEKDPAYRFQTAGEFARALDAIDAGIRVVSSRRSRSGLARLATIGASVFVLGITSAAAYVLITNQGNKPSAEPSRVAVVKTEEPAQENAASINSEPSATTGAPQDDPATVVQAPPDLPTEPPADSPSPEETGSSSSSNKKSSPSKKRKKQKKTPQKSEQPRESATPEKLSSSMKSAGIKSISGSLKACKSKGWLPGVIAKIKTTVRPDGSVSKAVVQKPVGGNNPYAKCLESAVKSARFAKTKSGGTFTYEFKG